MAEKETKKRRRVPDGAGTPNKKAALAGRTPSGSIHVRHADEKGLQPVLLSTPGLTTPRIAFRPYARARSKAHNHEVPTPRTHELLLHSSEHPRLDYTASTSTHDLSLSHYIAVFDPAGHSLQIQRAHHVDLRATPRRVAADADAAAPRTLAQQREALGKEFGTKKAKKAIASKADNALITDAHGKNKKNVGVQDAVLDAMADATDAAPRKEEIEQDLLASKPIPKPNLEATSVEDVYPFNTLIPPYEARLVPVSDWHQATRADEEIKFAHRYPAYRVAAIGKSEDVLKLKALRYLHLLLVFHDALQNAGKAGKKVPKKDVLTKKLAGWPEALVDSVRRRFATPQNELPKWHLDRLYTHMCALSLYIDGYSTTATDLKDDLRMENKKIAQYFHELGCKVSAPTEKERERLGLGKAQAAVVRIARLKLPLDFPKPRAGRRR